MGVARCRTGKWMLSAVPLSFVLPLALPLLCFVSFLAFMLFVPLGCAVVGLWSLHRLCNPGDTKAALTTDGNRTEGTPLYFLLVKSTFVQFLHSFVLVSQLVGLIKRKEVDGEDFEGFDDGCCTEGEGATDTFFCEDSGGFRRDVFLWYNPLASIFNAESNSDEIDTSESDVESVFTDYDLADVESFEGSPLGESPELKAGACIDTVVKADNFDRPMPRNVGFESSFDGIAPAVFSEHLPKHLEVKSHSDLLASLHEGDSDISCVEEKGLLLDLPLESEMHESIHQKREEHGNLTCAGPEAHTVGGPTASGKCAEVAKERNSKRGRKDIGVSKSASRAQNVGNDMRKSRNKKESCGTQRVAAGVTSGSLVDSAGRGQLARNRVSPEAGKMQEGHSVSAGRIGQQSKLGMKSAEIESARRRLSDQMQQASRASDCSYNSRRGKSSGIGHTKLNTCGGSQQVGSGQERPAFTSCNRGDHCIKRSNLASSSVPEREETRKQQAHGNPEKKQMPVLSDHGNLLVSQQTYAQLLEFWRHSEQSVVSQATSTNRQH